MQTIPSKKDDTKKRTPSSFYRKKPFDIEVAMSRIEEAVKPFPKAMLFQIKEEGHSSVFEQLIACLISIRSFDEVSLLAVRRLFSRASTPKELSKLSVEEIDDLIRPATFHLQKAQRIKEISFRVDEEFKGRLPADEQILLSFSGVGPKCANLALGVAAGKTVIGVDIHVHRVTNRWGYMQTRSPEKTLAELERKLPKKYWVEINRLLVPFGKHICTGLRPKCSTCPVLEMCQQIGVTSHR